MVLSDEKRRRYARAIRLNEIGEEGQEKLLASKVLVVGAGGLGSAVLSYLAAAGVGHIGIVDPDRVELSNLQRQILYETADIGRLKADCARDRLQELNPDIHVVSYAYALDAHNASVLIAPYDLVADGCDNFATRFAVSDACHLLAKPLVSAALRAWEGQLALFKSYLGPPEPCYRCFIPEPPGDERGCGEAGVAGPFAGIMGSLQALEIIKELTGAGDRLAGRLLLLDGLTLHMRKVALTRDPQCGCCGEK